MPRNGGGGRKLRSGKEIDRLEKKTEQELKKLGMEVLIQVLDTLGLNARVIVAIGL